MIKDDLYEADAEGAANYFGQTAVRDYLRSLERAKPIEKERRH
jgi:hypothetical protein